MSRFTTTGEDEKGRQVKVAYGYDEVPGFAGGYFFQVFDPEDEDRTLVNEGFLAGISEDKLSILKKEWKVKNKGRRMQ